MSSPSSSPRPASARASRVAVLRAWWFWGLLVALAAGGGWYYTQSAPSTPAGEPGKEGRRGGERSVPVTLGQVAKGDVRLQAVLIDVEQASGKALSIERLSLPLRQEQC